MLVQQLTQSSYNKINSSSKNKKMIKRRKVLLKYMGEYNKCRSSHRMCSVWEDVLSLPRALFCPSRWNLQNLKLVSQKKPLSQIFERYLPSKEDKVFKSGLSKFSGRWPLKHLKGYGLFKNPISIPNTFIIVGFHKVFEIIFRLTFQSSSYFSQFRSSPPVWPHLSQQNRR